MVQPSTAALTRRQLRAALAALDQMAERCEGREAFARRGVRTLGRLVGCDFATLSVCDLDTRHRSVETSAPGAISRREIEVFDRHFDAHPLVRDHGRNPRAVTRRISDLVSRHAFERTVLYNEYYRPIGIRHAMALPVHVDERLLVSFVFNRGGRAFGDAERDLAEVLRPQLAALYRLAGPPLCLSALTARETEVLQWIAAGKSNRDIAEILGARARTIEKHLERIYVKLGVENRTAAALRGLKG